MVKLPRLQPGVALVDKDGKPSRAFVSFWNSTALAIEKQEAGQDGTLDAIAAINIAQQEQIDRLTRALRAISHADGLFITAAADGATAKITITTHTRNYLDVTVSVTGAVLTGLDYGSVYSIYYDDADRSGGAVTYVATLVPSEAVTSEANPDRQLIGAVQTPLTALDPPTDGGGSTPPGYPPAYDYETP